MNQWRGLPVGKIAIGTAAVATSAAIAYYYLKKFQVMEKLDSGEVTEKVTKLKEDGNALFQKGQYAKAVELFLKGIKELENLPDSEDKNRLLAILFNNASACKEFLHEFPLAMEYSNNAIQYDDNYGKVYVRRSRLHRKNNDAERSAMDLGAAIRLLPMDDKQYTKLTNELSEDLQRLCAMHVDNLFVARKRSGVFLPISQVTYLEWVQKLAIHDPLFRRMEQMDGKSNPNNLLDLALNRFVSQEYDRALEAAIQASVDQSLSVRDRLLARVLSARIYHLADLRSQQEFMHRSFEYLWDESDEDFKSGNKDVLLAFWCSKVTTDDTESAVALLTQNKDLMRNNVDPIVVLAVIFQRASDFKSAFEMFKLARELEPTHPFLKLLELMTKFAEAVPARDVNGLHLVCAELSRILDNALELPEYFLLMASRIYSQMGNIELALSVCEKNKNRLDKCVPLQFLYEALTLGANDNASPQFFADGVARMHALLEKDPHNHEIHSLLHRFYQTAREYDICIEHGQQSLLNTRTHPDFTIRLFELLSACALGGQPLPLQSLLPYEGPEYIHADSSEYTLKLIPDLESVQ